MELPKENSNPEAIEANWHLSTWTHRACLAVGCASVLFSAAKSLTLTPGALESMLAAVAGYIAGDLATGLYHWAIDNYGSPATPFFGTHIDIFQYHHKDPLAITKRQLANNLSEAAWAVAAVVFPASLLSGDRLLLLFLAVFGSVIIFGQQFHAWAHTPKAKLPPLVVTLQDAGVILNRAEHAAHHRQPHNSRYCTSIGVCNRVLDGSKLFLALEMVVFVVLRHRPRSWGDSTQIGMNKGR